MCVRACARLILVAGSKISLFPSRRGGGGFKESFESGSSPNDSNVRNDEQ